ncbi:MAG: cation-transporting P-type ATPase, partial [Candidatus Diapherotrites archaeon]|nr:cation-transporting P-type ATPase [Candidatus Diapherotrites archaeon]
MSEYYNFSPEQALKELNSSEKGLTETEAQKRLLQFGLNKLEEKKEFSAMKAFISQFTSFLVIILIVAALISLFFGDDLDAIAIFAIVILNGCLGFVQEFKANKAMEALKKMASLKTKVVRDNEIKEIDSAMVVPGDIVILDEGTKVPA